MGKRANLGDVYEDKVNGYVIECVRGHTIDFGRSWVAQHIVRVCEKLGRPLQRGELVHHRNHNKHDNRLRNLKLTTRVNHMKDHVGAKRSDEAKVRMKAAAVKRCTPEWRLEVSERVKKQHRDGKFGRRTWKEK